MVILSCFFDVAELLTKCAQTPVSLDTGILNNGSSFFVLSPKFLSPIHYSLCLGLLQDHNTQRLCLGCSLLFQYLYLGEVFPFL